MSERLPLITEEQEQEIIAFLEEGRVEIHRRYIDDTEKTCVYTKNVSFVPEENSTDPYTMRTELQVPRRREKFTRAFNLDEGQWQPLTNISVVSYRRV